MELWVLGNDSDKKEDTGTKHLQVLKGAVARWSTTRRRKAGSGTGGAMRNTYEDEAFSTAHAPSACFIGEELVKLPTLNKSRRNKK